MSLYGLSSQPCVHRRRASDNIEEHKKIVKRAAIKLHPIENLFTSVILIALVLSVLVYIIVPCLPLYLFR